MRATQTACLCALGGWGARLLRGCAPGGLMWSRRRRASGHGPECGRSGGGGGA